MELIRFYQHDFEEKPGIYTLKSKHDRNIHLYVYRDFAVDMFDRYRDASKQDQVLEFPYRISNIERILLIAEQNDKEIDKMKEQSFSMSDFVEMLEFARDIQLSGVFYEYEGYVESFIEILEDNTNLGRFLSEKTMLNFKR